jgi:hypothetical protein
MTVVANRIIEKALDEEQPNECAGDTVSNVAASGDRAIAPR